MPKTPPEDDELDDADLLSESQFDLEADPALKKSNKPIVFLVISLLFAAGTAVFALYWLQLGPFAPPPSVAETASATDKPASQPASAPVVVPPKPVEPAAKKVVVADDDEPEPKAKDKKAKKAKAKKKAAPKKKKKK